MSNSVTPEQVIEAVEQVRDPEVQASEYSFLDDLEMIHPAPSKKGNDGLANWIADLAVFQVEGKTVVDEGLVEKADRILAEKHGNPRRGRNRIANISYDSENRPGDKISLAHNEVDGHERLLGMVNEFYRETGREEELENLYKDSDLLLGCDNMSFMGFRSDDYEDPKEVEKEMRDQSRETGRPEIEEFGDDVTIYDFSDENPEPNSGGDNNMTNRDLDHAKRTLRGAVEDNQDITDDVYNAAETLASYANNVGDLEDERDDIEDDYLETLRSFQSYVDQQYDELNDAEGNISDVAAILDGIDLHGSPSDVGLQDTLRNPGF